MDGSPALPGSREQRVLILRSQGQGHDAEQALLDLVETVGAPIVASQLKRFRVRAGERDDVEQSGYAAFLGAARRHDPRRPVPFEYVAKRRVRDGILDELGVGRPQLAVVPVTEAEPDHDAEHALDDAETAVMVRKFVGALTPLQQAVVKAVFWDGVSQADVARARGISRMAVTKVLNRVYASGRVALAALGPVSTEEVVPSVA
ncbi:MAG: sigma-70 family RNA polymerase sigma factor [Chloroflexi bacterium]|nr:sigma-70 family RNA polymerase sigma factor [Chloroflexota bacterium]